MAFAEINSAEDFGAFSRAVKETDLSSLTLGELSLLCIKKRAFFCNGDDSEADILDGDETAENELEYSNDVHRRMIELFLKGAISKSRLDRYGSLAPKAEKETTVKPSVRTKEAYSWFAKWRVLVTEYVDGGNILTIDPESKSSNCPACKKSRKGSVVLKRNRSNQSFFYGCNRWRIGCSFKSEVVYRQDFLFLVDDSGNEPFGEFPQDLSQALLDEPQTQKWLFAILGVVQGRCPAHECREGAMSVKRRGDSGEEDLYLSCDKCDFTLSLQEFFIVMTSFFKSTPPAIIIPAVQEEFSVADCSDGNNLVIDDCGIEPDAYIDTEELCKCPVCDGDVTKESSQYGPGHYYRCSICSITFSAIEPRELRSFRNLLANKPLAVADHIKDSQKAFLANPDYQNLLNIVKSRGGNCPYCDKGSVVVKRTSKGRLYLGCSNKKKNGCSFYFTVKDLVTSEAEGYVVTGDEWGVSKKVPLAMCSCRSPLMSAGTPGKPHTLVCVNKRCSHYKILLPLRSEDDVKTFCLCPKCRGELVGKNIKTPDERKIRVLYCVKCPDMIFWLPGAMDGDEDSYGGTLEEVVRFDAALHSVLIARLRAQVREHESVSQKKYYQEDLFDFDSKSDNKSSGGE